MTTLEKINGCMALLIDTCMKDTNADTFSLKSFGVTYNGQPLGDYQLTIKKVSSASEPKLAHNRDKPDRSKEKTK